MQSLLVEVLVRGYIYYNEIVAVKEMFWLDHTYIIIYFLFNGFAKNFHVKNSGKKKKN